MGITGLLPALRPVTHDLHVKDLKGLSVGVDTYCWLHKAVYACSEELCLGTPTDKHIRFALSRLDLLLHYGARPYLVCDGDYLPAKGGKEVERATKRRESLARAQQCLREGNPTAARTHFVKAVDVTPAMAARFLHAARQRPGVRVLVAPYEADAQLGYLCRSQLVDVVITEDSDLLLFGCHRVLFKLDKEGAGQHVALSDVLLCRNDELDFRGQGEGALLMTCALSGCDYLPSVPGMGLKKAHKVATRYADVARALRAVRFEFGGSVPKDYEQALKCAMATFKHQVEFNQHVII
jgi:exonuclease 1